MKYSIISSIITFLIGVPLLIWALALIIDGKVFGPSILLMIGITSVGLSYASFKKFLAEKRSNNFLSVTAPEHIELVDKVLSSKSTNAVINNTSFYNNNVKMVVMDQKRHWSLVVTKDCVFEGHARSYQSPQSAQKNIEFCLGDDVYSSSRTQLDVGKQAEMGFLVGGLGVGAMNAADAMRTNAEGGLLVSKKCGYVLGLKASGDKSNVHVIIIRNDLLERYGEPYMFGSVNKGKCFSAYFLSVENEATMRKTGVELTKFLKTLIADNQVITIAEPPKKEKISSNIIADFSEKTFVVAGIESKKEDYQIRKEIKERGGIIQTNITKKLDYLICPEIKQGITTRIDTAIEYANKGASIQIITVDDFYKAIK